MLQADKIEADADADGEILYSFVDQESAFMFNQMDLAEKQLFKLLQYAGDMGCTISELRQKMMAMNPDIPPQNVSLTALNANLKKLQKKSLIKTINNGQQPNRKKVFMIFEVEPSHDISGGPIGSTDAQGIEMVNRLMDRVFDFVCRQREVSLKELMIFMKQVGLNLPEQNEENSIKNFKDSDLERIVQAMIFDQRIEQTAEGYYRPSNFNFPEGLLRFKKESGDAANNSRLIFTEIPCCHCPLAN